MYETTRAALYEQIWSEPMRDVAKRFGISDVALAKLCRRRSIPVPGRGYWQMLQVGKAPRRPKLPTVKDQRLELIAIAERTVPPPLGPAALSAKAREAAPENRIKVPAVLGEPHPVIATALRSLRAGRKDQNGVLLPRADDRFHIRVTPGCLDRAVRIANALVLACEGRGYPVRVAEKNTWVTVAEEDLGISLEERLNSVKSEVRPGDKGFYSFRERPQWRYDRHPTGQLMLRILGTEQMGVRSTWGDGKEQRLEECLNHFLGGLVLAAEAIKRERTEQEARRRAREVAAKREAEREHLRWIEGRRIEELERQVKRWTTAGKIRQYVDQLEKAESVMLPAEEAFPKSLGEWVSWARKYANRLDPVTGPRPQTSVGEPHAGHATEGDDSTP